VLRVISHSIYGTHDAFTITLFAIITLLQDLVDYSDDDTQQQQQVPVADVVFFGLGQVMPIACYSLYS
jgi:hypothetical protein